MPVVAFLWRGGLYGRDCTQETVGCPAHSRWRAKRGVRRYLLSALSMEWPFIGSFIHSPNIYGALTVIQSYSNDSLIPKTLLSALVS